MSTQLWWTKSQSCPIQRLTADETVTGLVERQHEDCYDCDIGPADYNYDESLSILRYANGTENIKKKPRINEDPKDAMIR